MRSTYITFNGAAPTTAELPPVTTGTTLRTMLQVLPIGPIRVVEWGISFDGSTAAAPIRCELIHTGIVAATVTAHLAAGVEAYNDPNLPTSSTYFTLSTTGTGYSATGAAEGTITVSRFGDVQQIAPTNQYVKQWPLAEEFQVPAGGVLRVRVKAGAPVGCITYLVLAV